MKRTNNVYVLDDGLIDVLNKILAEAAVSWGTTEALFLAQIFRTATGVTVSKEDPCPEDPVIGGHLKADISVIPNDQLGSPLDKLDLVQFALNEDEFVSTLMSLDNERSAYTRADFCPYPVKSAFAKLEFVFQMFRERKELLAFEEIEE